MGVYRIPPKIMAKEKGIRKNRVYVISCSGSDQNQCNTLANQGKTETGHCSTKSIRSALNSVYYKILLSSSFRTGPLLVPVFPVLLVLLVLIYGTEQAIKSVSKAKVSN